MTILRRTLLPSGGAFLTAAALSVTTFALDSSGGGKVNVQDISITVVSEGDGAPKPSQIKFPDWKWDYQKLSETRQIEILVSNHQSMFFLRF